MWQVELNYCLPRLLLSDDIIPVPLLLALYHVRIFPIHNIGIAYRFTTFYHQTIQLEELTDNRLPLHMLSATPCTMSTHSRRRS